MLLPCGHGGLCQGCADKIASKQRCHMCRERVLRVALLANAGLDVETGLPCVHVSPQPPTPPFRDHFAWSASSSGRQEQPVLDRAPTGRQPLNEVDVPEQVRPRPRPRCSCARYVRRS